MRISIEYKNSWTFKVVYVSIYLYLSPWIIQSLNQLMVNCTAYRCIPILAIIVSFPDSYYELAFERTLGLPIIWNVMTHVA